MDRTSQTTRPATDAAIELSIIIVSWNTRQLLVEALESFLPLENIRAEIIVVDNASEDDTCAVIERDFPAVRLIRKEKNLGFAGGVNVGFEAARAPLMLLLNTDTHVIGDAIYKLVEYAQQHTEAGIIGPRVENRDGSLQSSYFRFPSLLQLFFAATYLYKAFPGSRLLNRERYAGRDPDETGAVDVVSGCCFLIRRAVLEAVGGFDEGYFMYAEETDLCFRARQAQFEVHYAPVGSIVHFGGGSSRLVSRRMFLQFRRSVLRFFRKHFGPIRAGMARLLLILFLLLRIPFWAMRSIVPGKNDARSQLGNYVAGLRFLMSPKAFRRSERC